MTTLTTLKQLITGPTTGEEGRAFVRDLVATAPIPIPVQVLDTNGTSEAAIVWALGEGEALRSEDRIRFARSGFRSLADREWLYVVAIEGYGVTPRSADFATTNVVITNTSGGLYGPFAAGELRFVNDATDAVYANETEVTIPIGDAVTAGVRAIETGSASDAAIGDINRLETPLEGVTVTNPQPAIGLDAESVDSLNDRIDAALGIFGVPGATGPELAFSTGGTGSSFESIAKNGFDRKGGVPREDGSRITVTRTKLVLDTLTGIYTLYVADEDGPLADGDLILVREAVQAYAEWLGTQIEVENTNPVGQIVSGALTIARASATDAEILDEIDAMLLKATREAPIGGFSGELSLRYVENAVESAGDAGKLTAFVLVDIVLSNPIAAVPMDLADVILFSRGTITITRVSP